MIVGYTQFKVGDLVCLSAYGEARSYNKEHRGGHWGIITELTDRKYYPYKVTFISKGQTDAHPHAIFHPRELKHFKPKKSKS